MAQGNLFQGQASGKIGDVVFMVRKGKQVSRVYTTSGARSGDAATEAARLQRVRFGASSNQWGLYKYISEKMYVKGKKTKESSYNYFVKKNIDNLPYLTKSENGAGVDCIMPALVAEGNLGSVELFYNIQYSTVESASIFNVKDKTAQFTASVGPDELMTDMIAQLKAAYPNASKVNYLFMLATNYDVEQEEFISVSQAVQFTNVTIDLNQTWKSESDTPTVADFFTEKISNAELKAIIKASTASWIRTDGSLIYLQEEKQLSASIINTMNVMVFPTDNNVNDVYTVNIPANNVPNAGVWANWYGYRTEESLQLAMSSYGYQAGVMRDDVAKVKSQSADTLKAYASKLAAYDAKAASEITASLSEEPAAVFKTARKKINKETDLT